METGAMTTVGDPRERLKAAFAADDRETRFLMRSLNINLQEIQKNLARISESGEWRAVGEQADLLAGVADNLDWEQLRQVADAVRRCADKQDAASIVRISGSLTTFIQATTPKE